MYESRTSASMLTLLGVVFGSSYMFFVMENELSQGVLAVVPTRNPWFSKNDLSDCHLPFKIHKQKGINLICSTDNSLWLTIHRIAQKRELLEEKVWVAILVLDLHCYWPGVRFHSPLDCWIFLVLNLYNLFCLFVIPDVLLIANSQWGFSEK